MIELWYHFSIGGIHLILALIMKRESSHMYHSPPDVSLMSLFQGRCNGSIIKVQLPLSILYYFTWNIHMLYSFCIESASHRYIAKSGWCSGKYVGLISVAINQNRSGLGLIYFYTTSFCNIYARGVP